MGGRSWQVHHGQRRTACFDGSPPNTWSGSHQGASRWRRRNSFPFDDPSQLPERGQARGRVLRTRTNSVPIPVVLRMPCRHGRRTLDGTHSRQSPSEAPMLTQPSTSLRHTSERTSSAEHQWQRRSTAEPQRGSRASRSWSTVSCRWRPLPQSLVHDPPHALRDTWNSYVPRETFQEASP